MDSIAGSEAVSPPPGAAADHADPAPHDHEAALSRKKQKKANKVNQKIKVPEGSVDVMVQHTNDDSVVSKRSAVAHNYIRDRFLRHFVKKPSRRSPLINRGYYLRMAVMTDLVARLVRVALDAPERTPKLATGASETPSSSPSPCSSTGLPPIQVLSLGAGYDTLALRLLLDSVDLLPHTESRETAAATTPSPAAPNNSDDGGSSGTGSTCSFADGSVLFVDVDFPAVLQSKAALMSAAPPRSFPDDWTLSPANADCPVSSPHYAAVGVDLRTASAELLPRLHRYGPRGFSSDNFTVIYAECVMQYMPAEDAGRLVELLAASFPNAVFMAYDQVSPTDSFGRVMQQSLRLKNSPLLGIQSCPGGAHMTRRALAAGMQRAWWANFYRVSRYVIAGAEKARVEALEAFDELEEWSEMCEHYGITMAATAAAWASVVARGCAAQAAFVEYSADGKALEGCGGAAAASTTAPSTSEAGAAVPSVETEVRAALQNWPSARYGFEGWGNGGAAMEVLSNGDRLVVSFGGFAVGRQHQRVNTVYVHSLQEGELRVVVAAGPGARVAEAGDDQPTGSPARQTAQGDEPASASPATDVPPPALVFHSFTRIGTGRYLVWGGRTNPASATNNAYLLTLEIPRTVSLGSTVRATWTALRVATTAAAGAMCVPSERYRHSVVCLRGLEDGGEATLLLLGGTSSTPEAPSCGEASGGLACYRLTVSAEHATIAYELLSLTGSEEGVVPAALHSAAALAVSEDQVLLSGGLRVKADVCEDAMWLLTVSAKSWRRLPVNVGSGRFSHSLTRVTVDGHDSFLLLGGSTWEEKSSVPAGLLVPAEAILSPAMKTAEAASTTAGETRISTRRLVLPADAPWWSRHSCFALGDGVVGVVGGGYTCFSFGTFAAKPQLLHLGEEVVGEQAWRRQAGGSAQSSAATAASGAAQPPSQAGALPVYSYDVLLSKPWPAVREVRDYSAAAFLEAARSASEPVVFRGVPLGDCLTRWSSPDYLTAAEGQATVSVHVAERSQLLDFVRKNFAFRHVTLAELVRHVTDATALYRSTGETPEETWYYRSIAAHMKNERSNLWTDFPELGRDFVLPGGAKEFIEPRLHQSCLRMNAPPMQLWTHFDTLDNVLCQVVGTKRVVLFPPSEYNNLYISGSSSAVINLDAPDLVRYPRFVQACKAARELTLHPGDMLFLPAMWFHHITTLNAAGADRKGGKAAKGDAGAAEQPPYNISVNVFYRHFEDERVYDTKDLYGNKDILAVSRLRAELGSAVRAVLEKARLVTEDAASKAVPPEYMEFALRQFLQDTESLAADISTSGGLSGAASSV